MSAAQVIQNFYKAMAQGDFAALRTCLHNDFFFQGPIDTFSKVEPYIQSIKQLSAIVERVDVKKMFVDDNDVCVLYDLITNGTAGTSFVAEWFQVKNDKIASIRIVFDPRPFAAMFASQALNA